MPVAMAAPFIPSAGKKPMPKIRNGSRIMLAAHHADHGYGHLPHGLEDLFK